MTIETEIIKSDIDQIVRAAGVEQSAVIPILHAIQKKYNYLPEPALRRVCEISQITPASITGVSTFYSQFRHTPVGKHIIHVCNGTACHVKGAELVYDTFSRELKIPQDGDTDPDGLFTMQRVACLGCCTLAPVAQIDDLTFGHIKPNGVGNILQDFLTQQSSVSEFRSPAVYSADEIGEIRIGLGSCCVASGSGKVKQALEDCLVGSGIQTRVKQVGCVGMCHRTPLLEVIPKNGEPIFYNRVAPEEVKPIVRKHYKPKSLTKRITNAAVTFLEDWQNDDNGDGITEHGANIRDPQVASFLGRQVHIATEFSGEIDPLDIEEYSARQGFESLKRCLRELSQDDIIEVVKSSKMRGRGGGGFPTGIKWEIARQAQDDHKYIICNGDEGDPGAFMDRMILESYPYRVIEGMVIAAYATGAHEGIFYIRAEYPLAVERIQKAIQHCEEHGLLGENIAGSGFNLSLKIIEGAGAFVCGEETAMIASIQGQRGNPSYRPPYPVEKGLWGHVTLVNNCETYATVPWIIRHGAEAFTQHGTDKSKGTKVFSLAGKIARGGLIEVPMGIAIREIVEEIGGGIEDGNQFKAVQIGGPSGGCIPAELADTKVDYEDLTKAGAMMGSGGLLVMDEHDCMVNIARYFLAFTCSQSCGKCTYCRIGTHQMLAILDRIIAGTGKPTDLKKLEELAGKTKQGSLCGLGKTAPNPVLTTLQYFRHEYEAHLDGVCLAKQCQGLIQYHIDDSCIGCTICAQKCPSDAIPIVPYQMHTITQELCDKCNICKEVCPTESVTII